MTDALLAGVSKNKKLISDAFDYIWTHPETGYKEWKTHEYLKKAYESLGYELTPAGNIPGFTAMADTGRPGPTVAFFGEMDALFCPEHPCADPETGAAHACGHCAQSASLLGLAAALKEPGALDGLCGRIMLVVVPAEELIEVEYRKKLIADGVIRYCGGKQEFIARGLLDEADIAVMIHSSTSPLGTGKVNRGSNGFIFKSVTFHGLAAHAGGSPDKGHNALYAATNAINAINALRETFRDSDHIRVHGIITSGGDVVNTIPDKVTMEYYVRAATTQAVSGTNQKINKALSGAALAMGCTVTIEDTMGYMPRSYDPELIDVAIEAMEMTLRDTVYQPDGWGAGSSDFGDVTMLMPGVHAFIGGSTGKVHGSSFGFSDPAATCEDSARVQAAMAGLLLCGGASRAKAIIEKFKPQFSTKQDYFVFLDSNACKKEAVEYREDGTVLIR
ncbi:MAG: amidohydrolase [Lachnospiraceae bacterium]|nr:amidohydrolase [Lachnospiraceae bacterium]